MTQYLSQILLHLTLGVFLMPFFLSADGFRNPPAGAAAQGRIGGRIAFTPDASAVTHNPANLVEFEEREFQAGVTFGYSSMDFTGSGGARVSSTDPWAVLPSTFAVFPGKDGSAIAYGVALTSPYGRSTRLEDEGGPLRGLTPYETQLLSVDLAPTIAMRVNDSISVGASVHVLYSQLTLEQTFPWSLAAGVPGLPDGATLFDADGTGAGVSAAVTWRLSDTQRLAATWRSPIEVDYSGDLDVTGIPPGAPAAPRSDFDTSITFPMEIALAYGIRISDRWTLEANVEWVEHSSFDKLELDAGVNTPLLPGAVIPANWEDNWTYGLSAAWQATPQWELRAGFVYLESPIPSDTMLPTTSEEDQGVVSVGAGYRGEVHRFDVSYSLGLFSGRKVDDSLNPAFNGEYEFEAHLVSLAYARTF